MNDAAAALGLVLQTVQNGYDHTARGAVVRAEGGLARAVHHALAGYIINRGSEPVVRRNVVKLGLGRGFGGLNIAYANLHCGSRHGEGVNRVALLNGGDRLAGAVGNGQLIQLVALVRGQGYGYSRVLGSRRCGSLGGTIGNRRNGYLVGRGAGRTAAGGTTGRTIVKSARLRQCEGERAETIGFEVILPSLSAVAVYSSLLS